MNFITLKTETNFKHYNRSNSDNQGGDSTFGNPKITTDAGGGEDVILKLRTCVRKPDPVYVIAWYIGVLGRSLLHRR